MAVWSEDEFISRAKTLAKAHVGSKTPLNDLVEKVAREAELSPDAIRTLGRLTNVAVFQEMFQQKTAAAEPDRMIEFEPGDPEVVIARVVKSADLQTAADTSGDKVAEELPDLMRAVRRPFDDSGTDKVASAEATEREAPRHLQVMRLRKLADELSVSITKEAMLWEDGVTALAKTFRRAPGYGPSHVDFEKAAMADIGADALPELEVIREELRLPALGLVRSKIAELGEFFTYEASPELTRLTAVVNHRRTYETLKQAHADVSAKLASL